MLDTLNVGICGKRFVDTYNFSKCWQRFHCIWGILFCAIYIWGTHKGCPIGINLRKSKCEISIVDTRQLVRSDAFRRCCKYKKLLTTAKAVTTSHVIGFLRLNLMRMGHPLWVPYWYQFKGIQGLKYIFRWQTVRL